MRTHLFTGFPGFIANEMIKELARQDDIQKVYVLVLQSEEERAKKKINELAMDLGRVIPIEIIIGDITKSNLGINEKNLQKIQTTRLTIWHLAAIYDLAVKEKVAWTVNVEGTRNVNDFIRKQPKIDRYMYFSTAYVAGLREGVLLETELIRPNKFKNHYEETKFEAELLVEELKKDVPTTIIRPGIVRGHSETGETVKFDGPYFFMNLIDRLSWLPTVPYIGRTTSYINVVPIDYIINATVYLSKKTDAVGETIHLTDPSPHPIEEVFRAMTIELTGKKPKWRLPESFARIGMRSVLLQKTLGVEKETLDYLKWNAHFDTAIAEKLLKGSSIRCPDFIDTIPTMTAFYNTHKKDPSYQITIGK
ncbi:SDR family oxidoreductase [Sporosarcina oncorhynchi]|uniref:SDR family oxidoreductase n=1 Tax=Sporosarcina oncorhynchi TaxID=3056444 RepID=A0ABZ0L289_9BACL|nr:SDR family oxidoreductase [Sporosarcina sp. T2O-4]WOV86285.1 SDR family oxidoreductase [Sporosarcina sp. T2O-4]